MRKEDAKIFKYILLVLISFLIIILLYVSHFMINILVPIFLGFFTALFLDPFIQQLTTLKINRGLSTFIVYFAYILVIGFMLFMIVTSISNVLGDMPLLIDNLREQINKAMDIVFKMNYFKKMTVRKQRELFLLVQKNIDNFLSFQSIQHYLIKPFQFTIDIIQSFVLYAISLIFIIPGVNRISSLIFKAFPGKNGKKINDVITNIKVQLQNYLVAKTIISFFVGFFTLIICVIFDIKYAPLWGIITLILNFIPYIGAVVTVILPMMLSIIQNQTLSELFLIGILLTLVHFIIGNIIEPKFMSKGVNLRPLVIFISLLIWGYIWGIAGVLLSVPIMSAFNLACENIETLKPLSILISVKEKE